MQQTCGCDPPRRSSKNRSLALHPVGAFLSPKTIYPISRSGLMRKTRNTASAGSYSKLRTAPERPSSHGPLMRLDFRSDSMGERNGFELPVPLVFLSNRGFSGSFVFSVGADRRSRRKRNGPEAGYFRLNRRNRQFESIPLHHSVHRASRAEFCLDEP